MACCCGVSRFVEAESVVVNIKNMVNIILYR